RLAFHFAPEVHHSQLGLFVSLYPTILQRNEEAQLRVVDFWGEMKSKPSIIFCSTDAEFESYGKNFGSPAMINLTPFGSYIIVKPDGVNIDVLSHEMCHAEFTERLGWSIKKKEIPAWFDEGLALMLDYRYPRPGLGNTYTNYLMEWQSYPLAIRREFSIDQLKDIDDFFGQELKKTHLAYLYSGLQVSAWMDKVGKEGLYLLIEEIKQGQAFQEVYPRILKKKTEEL
ncbi:MAG: hypothetical protein AAFU64_09235, partial [Bacteroidota bacterium]